MKMCQRFCRRSLVITRNEESQAVLSKLDIPTELEPTRRGPSSRTPRNTAGKARRCRLGRKKPVLAVCPINPFWWPVKPSVPKFIARTLFGAYKNSHYRSIYFHNVRAGVDAPTTIIWRRFAGAVKAFQSRARRFSRSLSPWSGWTRGPAKRFRRQLGGAPVFTSDRVRMFATGEHSALLPA